MFGNTRVRASDGGGRLSTRRCRVVLVPVVEALPDVSAGTIKAVALEVKPAAMKAVSLGGSMTGDIIPRETACGEVSAGGLSAGAAMVGEGIARELYSVVGGTPEVTAGTMEKSDAEPTSTGVMVEVV